MESADRFGAVATHYGRGNVVERIAEMLRAAGLEDGPLTVEQLAPLDQFHIRGREATLELAERAAVRAEDRVLDLGGGLGGPARTLAQRYGAQVQVVDLTESFCQAAEYLNRRTGLSHLVRVQQGSALAIPAEAASYDLVWMQHVSMNIDDKALLYAECRRVLRPGGRLAIHEVLGGQGGPVSFPVPWAKEASTSYLLQPAEQRELLARSGFSERCWVDVSAESLAATALLQRAAQGNPPPLSLLALLGPDSRQGFGNYQRNLTEGRVAVIQAVLQRA